VHCFRSHEAREGGLQKGGGFSLALGYQCRQAVVKKSLASRKRPLLIEDSKDTGAGTSDDRCMERSNIRGSYGGKVGWGFVLTSRWDQCFPLFWCSQSFLVLHLGRRDTKVGLFIEFGSL
jgi:hypothetical protein